MLSPCFRNRLPAPNHLRAWHSIHRISYEEVISCCPHRVTGTVALRLQWLLLLRLFCILPPHCISGVPSSLTQGLYTSLESWQCLQIHQSKGVQKKTKAADRNPKNTLLRVIPPTDIFRRLIWHGLVWHYALTRYPTLDLTYLNIFWHSIWHFIYFIWHWRICAIWHFWHSVRSPREPASSPLCALRLKAVESARTRGGGEEEEQPSNLSLNLEISRDWQGKTTSLVLLYVVMPCSNTSCDIQFSLAISYSSTAPKPQRLWRVHDVYSIQFPSESSLRSLICRVIITVEWLAGLFLRQRSDRHIRLVFNEAKKSKNHFLETSSCCMQTNLNILNFIKIKNAPEMRHDRHDFKFPETDTASQSFDTKWFSSVPLCTSLPRHLCCFSDICIAIQPEYRCWQDAKCHREKK